MAYGNYLVHVKGDGLAMLAKNITTEAAGLVQAGGPASQVKLRIGNELSRDLRGWLRG